MEKQETEYWYNHPALNKSYLCEQLYGDRERSTTAKFSMKTKGRWPFTLDEKQRLNAIRQQLMQEIMKPPASLLKLADQHKDLLGGHTVAIGSGLIMSHSERFIMAMQAELGGEVVQQEKLFVLNYT